MRHAALRASPPPPYRVADAAGATKTSFNAVEMARSRMAHRKGRNKNRFDGESVALNTLSAHLYNTVITLRLCRPFFYLVTEECLRGENRRVIKLFPWAILGRRTVNIDTTLRRQGPFYFVQC